MKGVLTTILHLRWLLFLPEVWARGNISPEHVVSDCLWQQGDLVSKPGFTLLLWVEGMGNSVHFESYSLCYSTKQSLEKNRPGIRLWNWVPDSAPGRECLPTGSLCFLGCKVEGWWNSNVRVNEITPWESSPKHSVWPRGIVDNEQTSCFYY